MPKQDRFDNIFLGMGGFHTEQIVLASIQGPLLTLLAWVRFFIAHFLKKGILFACPSP